MQIRFKIILFLVALIFCETTNGQKLKEPIIKISDFIKGLTDNDYLRATLMENGFTFNYKGDIPIYDENWHNTGKTSGTQEWWDIRYQRDDRNDGKPYQILNVNIQTQPDYPKVKISVSIKKEFFADYGEKLISEIVKSFPHKEVRKVSDADKTYFCVDYSRDIDKIIITYSFRDDEYQFQIYK